MVSPFSLSLACATATLMHCSHSSARFSSWAFSTYVLLSVKISKARGRLRSRRFLATTLGRKLCVTFGRQGRRAAEERGGAHLHALHFAQLDGDVVQLVLLWMTETGSEDEQP